MKRIAIAGLAAGAAMIVGGALGAVSHVGSGIPQTVTADSEVMNPMVGGQAMLPGRTLTENISASPEHSTLAALIRESGIALRADGQFTVFAPTNAALSLPSSDTDKAQVTRRMGYLVVQGRYDSQTLLKAISEGGGEARLRTLEGGMLLARMNGPANIILMDEKGSTSDIVISDVYAKNGVMHVIDHMLEPGAPVHQIALN